ncbi:MAG: hypothetical protein R3316_10480, partial [Rhodovibrionaceae bacterium]|nr:hypothetical protein [Rhodovibrionaceae bacterium]
MARDKDIDPALRPLLRAWEEAFGPETLEWPAEEVRAAMDAFGAEARPPRPPDIAVEEAALDIAGDRELRVRI